MKWFNYLLLGLFICLVVVFQTSFFASWGYWGNLLNPILWLLVYCSFFSKKNLWLVVFLGGFLLDLTSFNFGLNIIALIGVALSVNLFHKYHLALSNSFSWLLTSLTAMISYLFCIFILNYTFGFLFSWHSVFTFSALRIFLFIFVNLLGLLFVFIFQKLLKRFFYERK